LQIEEGKLDLYFSCESSAENCCLIQCGDHFQLHDSLKLILFWAEISESGAVIFEIPKRARLKF
jgi:hypothetical protein